MNQICTKCGLPSELCVCETIAKESQKILVRLEKRKFGKKYTVIDGIDNKEIDIKDVTKKLKNELACGGTFKQSSIELQGNHKNKVKKVLVKLGFSAETIEAK
ncbi:stress response translation initiation inhibitor YciH [Candidatus Woesearchaeota archaeon]|nr:stress response translation initiation inhibitor YciH [Candidatus Woesearchaeota archaeon]